MAPRATEVVSDGAQLDDRVTLRVRQLVRCDIPLVGVLICHRPDQQVGPTAVVAVEAEATLPLQRAVYRYQSELDTEATSP